jgi:hypothetical protein
MSFLQKNIKKAAKSLDFPFIKYRSNFIKPDKKQSTHKSYTLETLYTNSTKKVVLSQQ